MKNTKVVFLLLCVLAFCFMASPALSGTPEKHEEYMKNEDYKNAFEQFLAGMEEAKERLAPEEYKAFDNEISEAMETGAIEDMESGYSEAEAYLTAYIVGYEQTNRELKRDWLRKNAEDAQGFYWLKSDVFEGYLTLEKGEEENVYAVDISVMMKNEPHNSGDFSGIGKLSGSKMSVLDSEDTDVITIDFDGETAILTSTGEFKKSSELGEGVILDGEYLREKK